MVTRVQSYHQSSGDQQACFRSRRTSNRNGVDLVDVDVETTSKHSPINRRNIYEQFEENLNVKDDWFPSIKEVNKNFIVENLVDCQMDYLQSNLNNLKSNCNKDDSKTTGCSSDLSDESNQISNSFSSSSASTEEGDETSCHFSSSSSCLATNSKWGKKPIDQKQQWSSNADNQASADKSPNSKKLNTLLRKQVLSRFLNHTDDLLKISDQISKKCEKIEMKLLGVSTWETRNEIQASNNHPWSNPSSSAKVDEKFGCQNAADVRSDDAIAYPKLHDSNVITHENLLMKCHKRNLKQPVNSYTSTNPTRQYPNSTMKYSRQNGMQSSYSNKLPIDNCSNYFQKQHKLFSMQNGVNFSEIDIQNLHTWQSSLIIQRNFLNQQLNVPFANEQMIQSQLMYVNQNLEYVNQRITQHFLTCSNAQQQHVSNNLCPQNYHANMNNMQQPQMQLDYECDTSIASDILNHHSWFERPDDKKNANPVDTSNAISKPQFHSNLPELVTTSPANYNKNKPKQNYRSQPKISKPTSLFDTSSSKSQNIWKFDKDQL